MKNLLGLALVCAAALTAQDGVQRAHVPLSDPARPPRIHAHLMTGSIIVHGGNDAKEVLVEARERRHGESDRDSERESERESRPSRAGGMKRLDLPGSAGLEVEEDNNLINIKTASWNHPVDLVITVPRRSSLQLKCMNDGDIRVDQVDGEIEADNLNGKVTLQDVSGSVLAHSLNGTVLVTLNRVDGFKPMSFSTLNGDIDVTLPENFKANVRMKTDNGDIYSDFDVKVNPTTPVDASEQTQKENGKYHLKFDRAVRGTINGGGPDIQFTSFNGQIYIRKKK